MTSAPKENWFSVLESLRGICAVMVALFHFRGNNHFSEIAFFKHSWLFVDFFFVLSGFVIAVNYHERLRSGAVSLWRFMWLRFIRLYPLHLFILLLFVVFEGTTWLAADNLEGLLSSPPFTDRHTPALFLENLLLLQSLGISGVLSWKGPSWSISAELWTYLLFGAGAVAGVLGYRLFLAAAVASVIAIFAWHNGFMGLEADNGILRCIAGFAVGTLLWRYRNGARAGGWGLFEVPVALLVVLFVIYAPGWNLTILSPVIFGLSLWVFSFEKGILSKILNVKIILLSGTLSYSIYMIHIFVWARLKNVFQLCDATFDTGFFVDNYLGPDKLTGDIFVLVGLVLSVMASWITYTYIERPFQALGKRVSFSKERMS